MMMERKEAQIIPFPVRPAPARSAEEIGDLRFRSLIGAEGWAGLPEATRIRFSRRVRDGRPIVYAGEVIECRISAAGRLLAQLARLIGAPLPLHRDVDVAAAVSVTEDGASGGQYWTRLYGRRRGFPQVIRTRKRFCGPTGLEEYVGRGIGVALRLEVEGGALHFVSDHYFFAALGLRLPIPHWLAPGALRVSHIDCNHGWFAFMLVLRHRLLGELIRQTAMFTELARDERR
jgi:uncharacterized protein DUF4166